MNRLRNAGVIAPAILLLVAGTALATMYTWVGGASGDWNGANEWDPQAVSCTPTCHPNTTNDDAEIEECVDGGLRLTATLEIDDLSMTGVPPCGDFPPEVDFTTDDQPRTITTDTITIENNTITMFNEAGLVASGTEPCPASSG